MIEKLCFMQNVSVFYLSMSFCFRVFSIQQKLDVQGAKLIRQGWINWNDCSTSRGHENLKVQKNRFEMTHFEPR
jgi:hypothetical protein